MTTYTYGVTKGSSAGDSKVARGDSIKTVAYPDSASGTDVVSFAYNAQGQQIWKKDQAGNVEETDFDTAGRETARRVPSLDGDFDGAILRISRTYNSRGLLELVPQYDAATSGNMVDEVKYGYDSWGLLSSFAQDRNSAVGASGSVDHYEIRYVWAKATSGRNALRLVSVTFPSGRTVTLSYRSTAYLHDDEASRVTQILDEGTPVATYNYNGLDTVVGTTLDEPDVMSKQFGSTSGSFPDLDRFNRVVTSKWTKDLATDRDFYRVDLGYDRNSNIVSAEDGVHAGFDVLYTNDDLNRLVRAEEGTLSGGSITSRSRDQQWSLSQVGNWDLDKVDLNGDGDFIDAEELEDARTHNAVNELNARDIDSDSSDDYSLAYDEAGNLTDDGESYTYEWDAFYRLRKIRNRSTQALVAEYIYNGQGYRISIHEDTDDDGDVDASDKWFHHAFDERWRWVATFREDDSDPKEEFLHHAAGLDGRGTGSYIDLVVLRDRDINSGWTSAADGTLEERIYYCQNWRADVSALVTDAGQMLEWVKYSAYGVPFGLPGGDANSDGDCDAADLTQVTTWVEMGPYDVRGDVDLDGDVDEDDSSVIAADYSGIVMGRGVLTQPRSLSHLGWKGRRLIPSSEMGAWTQVNEEVSCPLGRTLTRTSTGRSDGWSLYATQYPKITPFTLAADRGGVVKPQRNLPIAKNANIALGGQPPGGQSQENVECADLAPNVFDTSNGVVDYIGTGDSLIEAQTDAETGCVIEYDKEQVRQLAELNSAKAVCAGTPACILYFSQFRRLCQQSSQCIVLKGEHGNDTWFCKYDGRIDYFGFSCKQQQGSTFLFCSFHAQGAHSPGCGLPEE